MKISNKYIVLDICSDRINTNDIFQIGMTYIEYDTVISIKSININQALEYSFHNINNNLLDDEDIKQPKSIVDFFKTLGSCPIYYYCNASQALSSEDNALDFGTLKPQWRDAAQIFQKYWPDETSYDLSSLCTKKKIQSQKHTIGKDSLAIAQLINLAGKKTRLKIAQKFLSADFRTAISS